MNDTEQLLRHSIRGHRNATRNSEGFRGIYWDREHSKWRAEICYLGRRMKLGRYRTPEAAAAAYNDAASKYYGEDAMLNTFGLHRAAPEKLPQPMKRVKRRHRRRIEKFYQQQAEKRAQYEALETRHLS